MGSSGETCVESLTDRNGADSLDDADGFDPGRGGAGEELGGNDGHGRPFATKAAGYLIAEND